MNFNAQRKQKTLSICREPDLDKVEKYRLLQYELTRDRERQSVLFGTKQTQEPVSKKSAG